VNLVEQMSWFTEVALMRCEFRGCSWLMGDKFWRHIQPLLPKYPPPSSRGGRPRANLRRVMDGIFYVLRNGCLWKAVPREFGSGSTIHRYFQEWTERGVFLRLWKSLLKRYDLRRHIGWNWQSVDGSMTKAPLGGEKNRKKPRRSR
jgi:putative transposase